MQRFDRRRGPRGSSERLGEITQAQISNEAAARVVLKALEDGDVELARRTVEGVIAGYAELWEARADYLAELRLELEELRASIEASGASCS